MKKLLSVLTLLCVLFGCSSCIFYVPTAGISLSENSISGVVNDSVMLSPTIYPSNATNQTVSWSSDNPSVASVSSIGLVTLHDIGEAIITAEAADGQKAYCYVVVQEDYITVPITIENWRNYLAFYAFEEPSSVRFYLGIKDTYEDALISNVFITYAAKVYYFDPDLGYVNVKTVTKTQSKGNGFVSCSGPVQQYSYEIISVSGTITYGLTN